MEIGDPNDLKWLSKFCRATVPVSSQERRSSLINGEALNLYSGACAW